MSESTVRIVLCYPAKSPHIQQIEAKMREVGISGEVINAGQERIAEELPTADIYCGHAKVPVPWAKVVAGGRLQWIQSSAAGMDHCLTPEVVESGITVSSASGLLANQVTDHTLALLLGLLRSLPVFLRAQKAREFIRRPTRDLHGARIGIIGFGGNGRRLAEILKPFGCEIHATDRFPVEKPEHVAQLIEAKRIDELLPQVDLLVLAAPLTGETRGLLDARRIALLPRGAILVNMARGPLVVEEDLAAALESGQLAGAGIDVTEVEPLPESSKLWDQPNLIITPHVGGQTARRVEDVTDFFCANLERFARGETLLNQIDKQLGYPRPEQAAWYLQPRNQ